MFELRPFHSNRGMTAYDPFREMENLERAFFGDRGFFSGGALSEFRTDIQDKGDSFLLEADLPGFKKEDIHIDYHRAHFREPFPLPSRAAKNGRLHPI